MNRIRKKKKRSGFTLVELMVVAVIVAILAAVAVPLMSANKKRAMATEAEAGCGVVRTAIRTYYAEHGALPAAGLASSLDLISTNDLDGVYFDTGCYSFTVAGNNYTITGAGSLSGAPQASEVAGVTIQLDQDGAWTRTGL